MDVTILNVAYNDIVSSLGTTLDEVSWASTAYILSSVTMLPLTGWLVARFGRKNVFISMMVLFGAGSLLCGLATSAAQLGAFRVLQGIGGGLLGAVSQSVLIDAYPAENRQDALNLLSVLAMVAPVLGPVVAGIILDRFSWPMVFFINVPLVAFTIWLATTLEIDQKVRSAPGRFSFATVGLVFASLFAFQYVVQSGERLDWFGSPAIRWSALAAAVLGGILIVRQLRSRAPMIDLRLFVNREFAIGNILSAVAGASNYGVAFIGPLFLQQVLGFSPFQTAMLTIPATVGLFAGNRFQDYFSRRWSVYAVVAIGLILLGGALWLNGVYADSSDFGTITWLRIIQGIAFGIFVVPTGVFAFKTISSSAIDSASGLFALVRQVSGMIGIALLTTLLEGSQNWYFRRLLFEVPRWPLLIHKSAASRADTIASLTQRALVMAYQHVYALSALVVLVVAILIIAYGIAQSFATQPLGRAADPGNGALT